MEDKKQPRWNWLYNNGSIVINGDCLELIIPEVEVDEE